MASTESILSTVSIHIITGIRKTVSIPGIIDIIVIITATRIVRRILSIALTHTATVTRTVAIILIAALTTASTVTKADTVAMIIRTREAVIPAAA